MGKSICLSVLYPQVGSGGRQGRGGREWDRERREVARGRGQRGEGTLSESDLGLGDDGCRREGDLERARVWEEGTGRGGNGRGPAEAQGEGPGR